MCHQFVLAKLHVLQVRDIWRSGTGGTQSGGVEGVWVNWLEVRGDRCRVILVVRETVWNALVILLVLQTFDDTGSLDYPPGRVIYRPSVSPLVTASSFLVRNKEVELKPTTFSSLLFPVFLSFLSSDIAPECCLLGLLLNNNIYGETQGRVSTSKIVLL